MSSTLACSDLLYRCSRFQSEIKRLKISSPVRVCQNCYYNLQHELGTEGRNWAPPEDQSVSCTSCTPPNILQSSHMSDNHMYSISFSTTGIKQKWIETLSLLRPPALITQSWKKRGKISIDGARSNRSPATARLYKLVYIVNIDHGLFNRTKNKTKQEVSE